MYNKNIIGRVYKALTFVEILVALSVMAVIFAVVVPHFRVIQNSWDSKASTSESLQNSRVLMDHLNYNLSKAVSITAVSGLADTDGYIEYIDNDGTTLRYDIAANNYVEFGPVGSLSELAGPVSQLQFACYDGNDFDNPTTDVDSIRFIKVQTTLSNQSSLGNDKSFFTHAYIRPGAIDELEETTTISPDVAVKNKVDWGGYGKNIDSYRMSQGQYDPGNPGSNAVVAVNATGSNKIVLWSSTILRGDAYIGPGGNVDQGIKTWSGSQITGTKGTLDEEVSIPNLSAPTGSPFDGPHEGTLTLTGSSTQTINTNRHFNKIRLWGHSKLTIDGDVTLLLEGKIDVGNYAELEILSDSSLNLYLKKTTDFWGHGKLNFSTKDPSKLRIYMVGNNKTMLMGQNAQVYAVLQNPRGNVNIWDNAQFFGKVKAKKLNGGGKLHVERDCSFD